MLYMIFLCVFLMETLIISCVWEMLLIKQQNILQRWHWTAIAISILHCKYTSFNFTRIDDCLSLWGCCPFWKTFFRNIALLPNCRNNVYIPQFVRWNWYSTGSLVVSTLECDARMPRFKPWPGHYNFPKCFIFFLLFWYFWF